MPHIEHGVFAMDHRLGANGNGDVEGSPHIHAIEAGRSDPDDLEGMAFERQLSAEDIRRAAEFALPKCITDHGIRRPASPLIIGGSKHTAYKRLDFQRLEEVSAHPDGLGVPGFAADGQVETFPAPRENARERLLDRKSTRQNSSHPSISYA